jgi:hypothetical protein
LEKKSMNVHRDSTAAAERQAERRIMDALNVLRNALSINELLHMAGDSLWHDGRQTEGEAIMAGVGVLSKILKDIDENLSAIVRREGGEK